AVSCRQARARPHLALIALRQGQREAAGDHRRAARRDLDMFVGREGGGDIDPRRAGRMLPRRFQPAAMGEPAQSDADPPRRHQRVFTVAKISSGRSAVPCIRSRNGMAISADWRSAATVMLVSTISWPEMRMVMLWPSNSASIIALVCASCSSPPVTSLLISAVESEARTRPGPTTSNLTL